jgi:hypothetical protein
MSGCPACGAAIVLAAKYPFFACGACPWQPPSRDVERSHRHREQRAVTIDVRRLSKHAREEGRRLYPYEGPVRPLTRGQCVDGARPCPFVTCRFNLYLDVLATSSIKLNFPDLEPDEMTESCALDIADKGGASLEDVARVMNMTRERVRQMESQALAKIKRGDVTALQELDDDEADAPLMAPRRFG